MTDARLVQQAVDGDKEAFSELVERYRHQVYALAFHHVHDFEAAHDLAQEAFVQAYLKLNRLRDTDKFTAWLRTLTTNLCRSSLRRAQLETVPLDDGEAVTAHDPHAVPHIAVERAQQEALVHSSIAALPERQRLTVTMFYMGGLSYQEIAKFLGESVNAVESRLHRARTHLHEKMMHVIDESFKSHHLPGHFTDEVLQKVQAIHIEGAGVQREIGWSPSVLLQDEKQRQFHIHLTDAEAWAIMTKATGRPPERPLPQTMLQDILTAFDINLEQVVLDDVRRGEFRARLLVLCDGQRHIIEARAGDALALAWGLNSGPELLATPKALRKVRRLEAQRSDAVLSDAAIDDRGAASVGVEPPTDAPDEAASTLPPELLYLSTVSTREAQKKERSHRQRPKTWARTDWKKQVAVRILALTSDAKGTAMVVLGGSKGRSLALWIGTSSAYSIKQGLGADLVKGDVHIALPPLPENSSISSAHDLIKSLLQVCRVELLWVAIDSHLWGVYYSVAVVQRDGKVHYIDARPSDSIALAVRCGCPIYAAWKVMKEHGVTHAGAIVEAQQMVELMETGARQIKGAREIIQDALQAVIDGDYRSACVTLTPRGETCHVTVKNKKGRVVWERVGGLFEPCLTLLYRMTGMNKRKPLPHTGVAECTVGSQAVGYRLHPIEVVVKSQSGPVELRIGEEDVTWPLRGFGDKAQ